MPIFCGDLLMRRILLAVLVFLLVGSLLPQRLLEAQVTFTVNSTNDGDDGVCGPGHCSLREAINVANITTGTDTIAFNLTGTDPGYVSGTDSWVIRPTSSLPTIFDPVIIDGYTQPGASPNTNGPGVGLNTLLKVELDGSGTTNTVGLSPGAGSTIRGLAINRFHVGIKMSAPVGNVIEGNFIGTDAIGTAALGNQFGVHISSGANNTVGGTTPGAANLISGNTADGVMIEGSDSTGNLVQGNLIGTDVNGATVLGNSGSGVLIDGASDNTIGGTTSGTRNVISGNELDGVSIGGNGSTGNLVQGNFIGTNANVSAALGNTLAGVRIELGASSNTIGARNVISRNGVGVIIDGVGTTGNLVEENIIGTDLSDTLDWGNWDGGIFIVNGAVGNTISPGGTAVRCGATPYADWWTGSPSWQ